MLDSFHLFLIIISIIKWRRLVAFRVEDVFGVEVVVDKISAHVVVTTDVGNVGFDIVCVSTDIGE